MDQLKRRESDKSFLRQLTPGNWIQIGLLLVAIIGGFVNFEWRVRALENQWIEANSRMKLLESKEMVATQLQAYRDNTNSQLNDLRARLDRIERKVDRIR